VSLRARMASARRREAASLPKVQERKLGSTKAVRASQIAHKAQTARHQRNKTPWHGFFACKSNDTMMLRSIVGTWRLMV
jgi:hypothetical protein